MSRNQYLETRQMDPFSIGVLVKRDVARLDFPGSIQNIYIRGEERKDSPRGTTGRRPPSGVPWATLPSYKR
ncbi:hypothetical protein TNCV_1737881 [Trichonephila clavipes]|nr:hypothetical protein TNCV_1737881 [Trichonephila clavipes]